MSVERHSRIHCRHSCAVVLDLDELFAAVLEVYGHTPTAGIYGILHKLFDHRCGPVHDLAGGNLIGHAVRKQFYSVGHTLFEKH